MTQVRDLPVSLDPFTVVVWLATEQFAYSAPSAAALGNGTVPKTKNKRPDLQNVFRQSYDRLTIMRKLRSTYDGRLIYRTSCAEREAFLANDSLAKL